MGTLPPVSVSGTCVLPVTWAKNLGISLSSSLSFSFSNISWIHFQSASRIQPLLSTCTVPTLVQPPSSPIWTVTGASFLASPPHTARGIPQSGRATPLSSPVDMEYDTSSSAQPACSPSSDFICLRSPLTHPTPGTPASSLCPHHVLDTLLPQGHCVCCSWNASCRLLSGSPPRPKQVCAQRSPPQGGPL